MQPYVSPVFSLSASPPLILPSNIMAKDNWHRAEVGRFDY